MQVQWSSLTAFSAACLALLGTSWSAQAIDLEATSSRPVIVQRIAETKTVKKCITVGGKELCLIQKKVSPGGVQQAPGNGAPQGGAEAPQGNAAGQVGNGAPQDGNGGAGGGNAAPPVDDAGAPPADNAGAAPADNGGAPAGGDADANLEPGEHVCPVGYLVLETKSKYGAFCEEVKGFANSGRDGIHRACLSCRLYRPCHAEQIQGAVRAEGGVSRHAQLATTCIRAAAHGWKMCCSNRSVS